MEIEPPYPLALPARRHWDRLAETIHADGRWNCISHDLLAQFCQTLALSQEYMNAILRDGALVPGSRTERDKVRHPLLTPLNQAQAMLVRLANAIPLVDPGKATSALSVDALIDSLVSE